jgi:hypothetical protein
MIVLAILWVICILGPIAGIGPIVRRGDQSQNNLLFVTMREPSWYEAHGQTYRAVKAQEIAEWWVRWLVAIPLAATSLLIDAGPYQWALSLGAVLIASFWSVAFYGQLDLLGRAVEVSADGRPGYLEAEAQRLRDGTRGTFRSVPVAQVEAMIAKRLPLARGLLRLLARRIG